MTKNVSKKIKRQRFNTRFAVRRSRNRLEETKQILKPKNKLHGTYKPPNQQGEKGLTDRGHPTI